MLRFELERRGTSQAELARLLGTKEAVVSRWCRGKALPGRALVEAIERALELPPGRVFRWTVAGGELDEAEATADPLDARELLAVIERSAVDPHLKRSLLALLRGFVADQEAGLI